MNTFMFEVYLRSWKEWHPIPWQVSQVFLLKELKEALQPLWWQSLANQPTLASFSQTQELGLGLQVCITILFQTTILVIIKVIIGHLRGAKYTDWLLLYYLTPGDGLATANSVHAVGWESYDNVCSHKACLSLYLRFGVRENRRSPKAL